MRETPSINETGEFSRAARQDDPDEFYAGSGTFELIADLGDEPVTLSHRHTHKLSEWKATAICGNDITSSCLYVSALAALHAGPWAPLVLAIVAAVLYLFRSIYAEVGSALPLNGGAYNVLLNTTSKAKASLAACLTILSYVATAVISAHEAMHYAHEMWHGLPVFLATVGLLGLFAALNLMGITESAVVALGIFLFHMSTLTVLSLLCGWAVMHDSNLLWQNFAVPPTHGIGHALFFGFAAAMLGISGFESSANFIEEQANGVFAKTLRNMWIAVAVFNPLLSLLSLGMLPLADIQTRHQQTLLAAMGEAAGGSWLQFLVSLDAVLVLSGAVLTSYVGVTGLVRRMSLDRCLPDTLLQENNWRHTNHWIIIGFFILCCSILTITHGNVSTLAGVYTISFLMVMSLFAVGNILLKVKRARLPRDTRASWISVITGLMAVLVGLVGNIMLDFDNVTVFAIYFAATVAVVSIMFLRIQILRGLLKLVRAMLEQFRSWRYIVIDQINRINDLTIIYFTRGDNLANLNRAAEYVIANEQTRRLKVVHVYNEEHPIAPQLAEHLATIDELHPELRVDFVAVKGHFGPELIERLSQRLGVPKNYMFIGTPGHAFPHRLSELGGVRLIL